MLAIQNNKTGFRVLQHERRPGEPDHAILTRASLSGVKMTGTSAVVADFRDADLSNATLNGAKLCRADLDGANLSGAELSHADFSGASLRNAVVAGANFGEAVTTGAEVEDMMQAPACMVFIADQPLDAIIDRHDRWCRTCGRDGQPGIFSEVDFRCRPSLAGRFLSALRAPNAIFFGVDRSGAHLKACDLSGADLRAAALRKADHAGAKLARADHREANLGPLTISDGRQLRADLTHVVARYADLRGVILRRARLIKTDLVGAKLDGADISDAETDAPVAATAGH